MVSTLLCIVLAVSFFLVESEKQNVPILTSKQALQNSLCGKSLQSANGKDIDSITSILPTLDFWNFFSNRTSASSEILLIDADEHSWEMLLNNVAALKRSGSKMAQNVYAIAYDEITCKSLLAQNVPCYYSLDWYDRLIKRYKTMTRRIPSHMEIVQMGRMMTTTIALCEGHNVFLSDTDVAFFRDPIQYAFHEANIMITATAIKPNQKSWGGNFFADSPQQFYTLNNGVVFYRSNNLTNAFVLALAIDSIKNLKKYSKDGDQGFLQQNFNAVFVRHKLALQPGSKYSNPVTHLLNKKGVSNTVGECYDCYHGKVSWSTKLVKTGNLGKLTIGVFPMQRYTSVCHAPNRTEFERNVSASASALRKNDTNNWGWGALPNNESRVLFTHANCVDEKIFGEERYLKKIEWLKSTGSWFL